MSKSPEIAKQTVVCVLGMGRSGTSLLTRVSNLIGLYLGPERRLLEPNDGNPTGYWENSEIVEINNLILAKYGGSWDDPPDLPPGWEGASSLDQLRQRARALLQDTYSESQLWGWKDPRNCLTLPFWQQLLPEMRYVICLRNPLDVARSLERLYGFSLEKSSKLWLTYVSSALVHSDGQPRLRIFYEDLIEDSQTELRRLAQFLGKPEQADRMEVQEVVKEFIEKELQHSCTSLAEMVVNSKIDTGARALNAAEKIGRRFGRKYLDVKQSDPQLEKVLDLAATMEFTGERFVPSENGQIKYEHLHRYALSLELAAGKSVLDVASGEGYGAALLAQVAQLVTGVDIDPETVSYSKNKYGLPNLNFLVGSCDAIPLSNASVDVITSFETIEHHDRHEELMLEIKRVLSPNGTLIISSPNRVVYSDDSNQPNPFHVKELYYEEFNQLLKKHFKNVQFYGQRLATGSFITPLQKPSGEGLRAFSGDVERLKQHMEPLPLPVYFLAVCSDGALGEQRTASSVYVDGHDDLFRSAEIERINLVREIETGQYNRRLLGQEIDQARGYQTRLETEIERYKQYQRSLEKDIASLEAEVGKQKQYQSTVEKYVRKLEKDIRESKKYQSTLETDITRLEEAAAKNSERQSALEKQVAELTADLEAATKRGEAAQDQLGLQAIQLSQEVNKSSVMRDQLSDLEALLNRKAEEIRELRAQVTASQQRLTEALQMLALKERQADEKRKLLLAMGSLASLESKPAEPVSFWKQLRTRREAQRRGEVMHGFLDTPIQDLSANHFLDITGWAYSTAAPIQSVGAFLDNVPLGLMNYGEPRPDLTSDSSSAPPLDCGFSGRFMLDEFSAGRRSLVVRVMDERRNIRDFLQTILISESVREEPAAGAELAEGLAPKTEPRLRVKPELVPVGKIVGVTEVTWDTGDGIEGEVYVSVNGEAESLFASGSSGSKEAPWILSGSTYQFRLYAGIAHERLLGETSARGTPVPAAETRDPLRDLQDLSAAKQALSSLAQISLKSFLAANSTIDFPSADRPELSIILVLYNRAELTLQCFYSILRNDLNSYEVVIVDNDSANETAELLARVNGAKIIRNATNLHFLRACNQAARRATGKYLLLLNNDAQLLPGSIASAVRTLNASDDIGAVGGKLLLPNGSLQEAGSIIWQDASCLGYGRGERPFAPPYMYRRDVDYCSGAFLLTPRELFLENGGFDEAYIPAYYEETDYCVKLWEQGKRVVFDPNAIILHYEFASSSSQESAIELQIKHREIFASKHTDWLQYQHAANTDLIAARSRTKKGQRRVLFIDDRVPHLTLGAGFPRSNRILTQLVDLGHSVTFYPTTC